MRLLVFGIHPDDIELGCGGTVAAHARLGHDVVLADLTRGEASSNGTPEERAREAAEAAGILGCRERRNLSIPDAGVRADDPDQQRTVVDAIRDVRPDIVVLPFGDDPHPDHASGASLVERAMYLSGIHGYPSAGPAWKAVAGLVYSGRRVVRPDIVVDTTGVQEVKMRAIRAHATQFGRRDGMVATPLNAPGFLSAVDARDRTHGLLIGVTYGEAFQTLAPVPLADFGVFQATRSSG